MNSIRLNVKGTTICTRTYFEPLRVFIMKESTKKTHTHKKTNTQSQK